MWPKLILAFLFCELLWTNEWLFNMVFGLFPFLKQDGSLHEWQFRSGLDRFVTAYGMLFAYLYPTMEETFFKFDKMGKQGIAIKAFITAVFCVLLYVWYREIGGLTDKFEYNAYHPYTSFIPISCFIFIRNMFPTVRKYYLWGFSWIGKITLETYLLQFHLMLSNDNKQIVNFLDGYPNLNFLITWLLLLGASQQTFKCTVVMSEFFFPYTLNTQKVVARCIIVSCGAFGFLLLSLFVWAMEEAFQTSPAVMWLSWFFFICLAVKVFLGLPAHLVDPLMKLWCVETNNKN
jgi:hypothetical protein